MKQKTIDSKVKAERKQRIKDERLELALTVQELHTKVALKQKLLKTELHKVHKMKFDLEQDKRELARIRMKSAGLINLDTQDALIRKFPNIFTSGLEKR